MKHVLLRAPALTQSGYGVHARQVAKWLLNAEKAGRCKVSTQLLAWGDTPWILDENRFDGLIGELMQRSAPRTSKCDVSIQLQLPNEWDPTLANFNVGMTAAVETDRCNPEWVAACNAMSLIIVPSEHTKRVLLASGDVKVPLLVVPESFPEVFSSPESVDLGLNLDTTFNFLLFGQITGTNPEDDRKNLFYTIKWLSETFKDNKDVGIIIKTNHGRNTRIDRNVVSSLLQQLMREIRKDGKGPPLHLLHGDLNDNEVHSLLTHKSVKALVSLTRGEGFGLPMLEAAACGLPVIATNWSAHTEFLNKGKWIQVDYSMSTIHESRVDNKIFMKDTRWAKPSEENFKKRAKKFYESPSTPKEWASSLKETVLKEYSYEAIAHKYDEAFKGIL